jgi:hypothetical protein
MNQTTAAMSRHFRSLAITAFHESAHAVIALSIDLPFSFVTIGWPPANTMVALSVTGMTAKPRGRRSGSWGYFNFDTAYDEKYFLMTHEKIALSVLAGPHGQRKFAPRSKWRDDAQTDHKVSRAVIRERLGLSGKAAVAKFAELDALAAQVVADNWPDITKVAEALIERRTMIENEVRAVLGRRPRKEPWEDWTPRPGIIHPCFDGDGDDSDDGDDEASQ